MWIALLMLSGCDALAALEDEPPRNCEVRHVYWPDSDGDGLGEPTDIWLACTAPDGWVLADSGETGTP